MMSDNYSPDRLRETARVVRHIVSSLYRLGEVVVWAARSTSQRDIAKLCEPSHTYSVCA
jgi:hypothetical protein